MIYCYKKLRELRLTHIFFLHYSVSLLIGGASIAGLFLLGRGLQFFSIVVLCYMYTQPAIFMLRRMDIYEVKHELKYGDYNAYDKVDIALEISILKPGIDKDFVCNVGSSICTFLLLCVSSDFIITLNSPIIGLFSTMLCAPSIDVWLTTIRELKTERENV